MEPTDGSFIKNNGKTGVGICGAGYIILETYCRISALMELGIPVHMLQVFSSAAALGGKLAETGFQKEKMDKIILGLIRGGPKVFEEVAESSENLKSLVEYLGKLSSSGLSLSDLKELPMRLMKLKSFLSKASQPAILNHDPLYRLIDEDLKVDFNKIALPSVLEDFQIITKNDTRGRFSIWSTKHKEIQEKPSILREPMVGSMCLPPIFRPKNIFDELHSDGLTLVLNEFIDAGCQTIILFCSGQFGRPLKEENVLRQNLIQRLINDFHIEVDMRLVEELNDALALGYKIFCDDPDSLASRIDEPSKIARLTSMRRKIENPKSEKQLKIILVTRKTLIPGLSLMGFPKENFEETFLKYRPRILEETKQFLTQALLA